MIRNIAIAALMLALIIGSVMDAAADGKIKHTRTRDVIYGKKHTVALTMDVIAPAENANGRGIIFCVSAGWYSSEQVKDWLMPHKFVDRGYTVFAVTHGTQPRFTIDEIVPDIRRAVRFIRYHAGDYGVDPDKLGVYGASAGGHLSLMMGTSGADGDPNAADAVDRQSSRVAAVACFFPPTDFLNYGAENVMALGTGILAGFAAPFDFREFSDSTGRYERVSDARRREIAVEISPIYHVSPDDPPILIVHGDADKLVPYQQALIFMDALHEAGVTSKLITQKDADHGWEGWETQIDAHADWFDVHLK